MHAGFGLGEGAGREPDRAGAGPVLHSAPATAVLRRVERPAARPLHRLRQGVSAPGVPRSDHPGSVRGRPSVAGSLSRPLRWVPRGDRIGIEDLSRSLRQQQILRRGERRRPPRGDPRLCRPARGPPGWALGRGTPALPRPRRDASHDPWHYVPVLARKPGARRNDAPFKDWVLPGAIDRIHRKLAGSNDGDRQIVDTGSHNFNGLSRRSACSFPVPASHRHRIPCNAFEISCFVWQGISP